MNIITKTIGTILIACAGVTSAHATLIGDSTGDLWDYDVSTDSATLIGNSGVMFDIALDPISDILYGVTGGSRLYFIDQSTASTSLIGNTAAFINGLTFSKDGTLYGTGSNRLYTIDLATGSANLIGAGSYSSSGDIAFDDSGNLYLSSTTGAGDSLWSLDTSTGIGSLLGPTGFNNVYGLNYANSTLYGFTSSGFTIALDTLTGVGTSVSTNGIQAFGADGAGGVTNVSESSSIALFALGLIGLGLLRKKYKR